MNKRTQILQKGVELTNGDRNVSYGEPHFNLKTLASLIETYLRGQGQWVHIDATDAAVIMTLAKISRVAVNKDHEDNYLDGAVYMAIAGECAEIEAKLKQQNKIGFAAECQEKLKKDIAEVNGPLPGSPIAPPGVIDHSDLPPKPKIKKSAVIERMEAAHRQQRQIIGEVNAAAQASTEHVFMGSPDDVLKDMAEIGPPAGY